MHSKRRYKIFICSVILGELINRSFRNWKGFSILPRHHTHYNVMWESASRPSGQCISSLCSSRSAQNNFKKYLERRCLRTLLLENVFPNLTVRYTRRCLRSKQKAKLSTEQRKTAESQLAENGATPNNVESAIVAAIGSMGERIVSSIG